VASKIRFYTPLGFGTPVQLAFVPLVFAMPPAIVPVAIMVAFALAMLPDVIKGGVPPSRLVLQGSNAWFSIGPVAVFAIAHTAPAQAGPGLLLAALAAQFFVDFALAALDFTYTQGASFASVLRGSWIYGIDTALVVPALLAAESLHTTPLGALAVVPLLGLLAVFAHERKKRLEGMLELSNAYRGTALVLGDVVEADDSYTGQHCKSVVALALEVAERLDLSAEGQRNLEFGALLHDVGKVAIPKEIINKPGKLDPHEWTIIKTHTLEGQRMLDQVGGFMREVGLIVRSHHERWDGGGYPDGLAGQQIPLEARIIACCDTWNAMRTDRPYRQALSYEVAETELRSASGTQLDPAIVEVLLPIVALEEQEEMRAAADEPGSADEAAADEPVSPDEATAYEPVSPDGAGAPPQQLAYGSAPLAC
ncbi:MAG: HD-GYP domain-containing protein, partial [Solirubrobacterales bacterium]|nr:HD-GYP domain-containing protein [Solirubrobacterales bacterium]